ncbi:TolC family protein [Heliobacterium chlorum]|uniref:TolC family protein n=1 Tax=Heliobacterium chlorum TaxID=2698 RepID=A0ABR7SZY8_HELCL|nr:TolC family protein [Heliobacterium chlorum]MBC9784108.1 TolC family protein [Heliobacterium chlorum]
MKKQLLSIFAVTTLLAFHSIPAYAEENTFNLEEATVLAISHSRDLEKSQLNIDRARINYDQAERKYDNADSPSSLDTYGRALSVLDEYYNQKHILEIKLSDAQAHGYQDQINDISYEIALLQSRINVQEQTVDSAESTYRKDQQDTESLRDKMNDAKDNYDDATIAKEQQEEALKYDIQKQYAAILQQEQNILVLQRKRNYQKSLLEVEKKRLALGGSSKDTVSQLEQTESAAESSLAEAQRSLATLKGNFNEQMGRDYKAQLNLKPLEVKRMESIPTFDELSPIVRKKTVKLSQLERDIQKKDHAVSDIESDRWDTSKSADDLDYQEDLLHLDKKGLQVDLKEQNAQVEQSIRKLLSDLASKQESETQFKNQVDTAQRQYDADKKRYELGYATSLQVMKSEMDLFEANQKLFNNERDIFLTQQALTLLQEGITVN